MPKKPKPIAKTLRLDNTGTRKALTNPNPDPTASLIGMEIEEFNLVPPDPATLSP